MASQIHLLSTAIIFIANTLFAQSILAKAPTLVHDAEYYILYEQLGDSWAKEDKEIDQKLKALQEKHGRPPNIVHILWDDTSFGDVGIPAINKKKLPFDPMEYLEYELPYQKIDPDFGQ